MLHVYYYYDKGLYRWYVLNDSHVMDQGVAKSLKVAENKANSSLRIIAYELDGVLA